jgi:EmrB/QacA subfamily drug resistance transporter
MKGKSLDEEYKGRYSILFAVMLGSILGPIDASIVNTILPTITQSFQVGLSTAQWVTMIYLLIISSLLLFYGRLGDILGYRKVYLFGLGGFIVASGLCSLSTTIRWLIAFRALQGLAAGLTMAVPFAIVTASFPPEERGKALGINAISISVGLALGPSLGGFITSLANWRLVFLINVPIGLAALIWGYLVIPELKGRPGKIDAAGVVTAFIALFSLLFFVRRLQSSGLDHLSIMALLTAVAAGIAFFRIESKSRQPLLDLNLFRNLTFSFANVSALLNFMAQYVMVFITPFFLQGLLAYPPNRVGLIMTAFPLATMTMAPLSGSLSDRVGSRTPACIGAVICAVALLLMSRLSALSGPADVAWRLALFGIGTGLFQSPNHSAVMGSAPRSQLGVASGILGTMRNVGMVFGVAAGGAVLFAFAPAGIFQTAAIGPVEAGAFSSALGYAYMTGAVMAALSALTSTVGGKKLI